MRRRSWLQGWKYWHGPQKKAQVVLKTPCRICHCADDDPEDLLVAPCACSGSLRCVHSSCQRAWLMHRPGPLEYKCELCGHALACHLRLSTRVEIVTTLVLSASAWTLQLWSLVRTLLLAARVVVATYLCRFSGAHPQALLGARRGGHGSHSFQVLAWGGDDAELTSPPVFELNLMAHRAGAHLALFLALVVVAQQTLSAFGRPATLLGEDYLARVSIAKIAFCMLVLFRQVVWALPPVQHAAPPEVWRALGATLVLDAVVLALRRTPPEERRGGLSLLWRLGQGACRSTGDFLPFTLMFLLWLASVVVIGAASLLPGLALLFRQALFDIRLRRRHSGSVQLAALALRLAARLAAAVALSLPGAAADGAGEGGWLRFELNIAACWLMLEAVVALDLWVLRRGGLL